MQPGSGLESGLGEGQALEQGMVYCSFLTGPAGTGKTTALQLRRDIDPEGIVICASTGIASVNMGEGVTTIHSALGFFNDSDLQDKYITGRVTHRLEILLKTGMRELVVDECFDSSQPILTEYGWRSIRDIAVSKTPISVWAYNEVNEILELCPVLGSSINPAPPEILRIVVGYSETKRSMRHIRCTKNHKIFTSTGWQRADTLQVGHMVLTRASRLSTMQRSVLVGGLLGDAAISRGPSRNSPQVSFIQGEDQLEYLRAKQRLFGIPASAIREGKSGYGDKKVYNFHIPVTDDCWELRHEMKNVSGGKHGEWIPTDEFIAQIDATALAVWFMDDGSSEKRILRDGSLSYYATIASSMFNIGVQRRLAAHILRKFGINARVANDSRGGYFLSFSKEETSKLFDVIVPFIPPCMAWKVPITIGTLWPEDQMNTLSWAPVSAVSRVKPRSSKVYDLQIGKNHTYVAGNIVVHNCSMLSGTALQIIYDALEEAADRFRDTHRGFQGVRLSLIGDPLQLGPIGDEGPDGKKREPKWFFEADCWAKAFLESQITRLTHVYRQTAPEFLAAMALARTGEGAQAAKALERAGVRFASSLDDSFAGTTILAKNDQVDRYNAIRLGQVEGGLLAVRSKRWMVEGMKEPSEWRNVPELFHMKAGGLVMILANDIPDFNYANGDLGTIVRFDPEVVTKSQRKGGWIVKLNRNGREVAIGTMIRRHAVAELGKGEETRVASSPEQGRAEKRPFRFGGKWAVGEVEYFPLRLAYGATPWKTQSLSLDNVQVDLRNHFMGTPGALYVALSRARTPEGLRIVGDVATFVKRLRVNERVRGWI